VTGLEYRDKLLQVLIRRFIFPRIMLWDPFKIISHFQWGLCWFIRQTNFHVMLLIWKEFILSNVAQAEEWTI